MGSNLHSFSHALLLVYSVVGLLALYSDPGAAADRLIGLHSAQVMSQSMPWIAQEAGLFKKYDLDFRLVFIPSSAVARGFRYVAR